MTGSPQPDSINTNAPVNIVQSTLPYNRDDPKARYLSFRVSGFTIREALKMVGNGASTLSLWRKDPMFVELEKTVQQFAQKLRTEYVSLEFVRNFRLIMEKDYQVLKKSLELEKDEQLSKDDQSYLLKLRGFYTPQQLQIIEALVQGELQSGKEFSWTEAVLTFRKIEERSVKLKNAMPSMPKSDDTSGEQDTVEHLQVRQPELQSGVQTLPGGES